MTGWLAIAGLGPGAAELITPEVSSERLPKRRMLSAMRVMWRACPNGRA